MTLNDLIESKEDFKLYYYNLEPITLYPAKIKELKNYEVIEIESSIETQKAYKLKIDKKNHNHAKAVRKINDCTKCCRYPWCDLLAINKK